MAPTHSMDRVDAMRERRWRRIQVASGLLFFAFASHHVANRWLAPGLPLVIFGYVAAVRGLSLRFDLFPRFAEPE
jgi:hypothetical protein